MSELKTIRIIPFSGKAEDWNRWSKTFLATATAKRYKEVLKPSDPTKKADSDFNNEVYNHLMWKYWIRGVSWEGIQSSSTSRALVHLEHPLRTAY